MPQLNPAKKNNPNICSHPHSHVTQASLSISKKEKKHAGWICEYCNWGSRVLKITKGESNVPVCTEEKVV